MNDIIMTDRISGTPCTVINTPYAKKIGTKQNQFERFLSNNPRTKKYFKMLVQRRGYKWLEQAVTRKNYKNLWCAGQSVKVTGAILHVKEIINRMMEEMQTAFAELNQKFDR